MTGIERIMDDISGNRISHVLNPMIISNRNDYQEYIQRIREGERTLDEVKQLIRPTRYCSKEHYVFRILVNRWFEVHDNDVRPIKWLSKALARSIFDSQKIQKFSRKSDLKDWEPVILNTIRNVKSFDVLAELFTDNKIFEPLISAYVRWIVKTKGIEA